MNGPENIQFSFEQLHQIYSNLHPSRYNINIMWDNTMWTTTIHKPHCGHIYRKPALHKLTVLQHTIQLKILDPKKKIIKKWSEFSFNDQPITCLFSFVHVNHTPKTITKSTHTLGTTGLVNGFRMRRWIWALIQRTKWRRTRDKNTGKRRQHSTIKLTHTGGIMRHQTSAANSWTQLTVCVRNVVVVVVI